MARVSEAQTKPVGAASSRRWALASRPEWTVSSEREARPVVESPRVRIARVQPARRSSPITCSLRQPTHAMRWWPRSIRWVVASSTPAAPSTSTHGWTASSLSHGRPKATNGARRVSSHVACGLPR